MAEPETAFKEAWADTRSSVKAGRYQNAANIAFDVTHFVWILKRQDELFMSEVLGSACMDIDGAIKEYVVPATDVQKINGAMAKHMEDLLSAYEAQPDVLGVLKKIAHIPNRGDGFSP